MKGLLVCAAIVVAATPAFAQDPAPDSLEMAQAGSFVDTLSVEEAGEQAAELIARVNAMVEKVLHYRVALDAASPEDSLVLRLQRHDAQIQALEDLSKLVAVLENLEKEAPRPELRISVQNAFVRVTPHIWPAIERRRAEIDRVRADRPSTGPADLMALEDHVATLTLRLNRTYELSHRHIELLRELGVDSTDARSQLADAFTTRADELAGRIRLAQVRIREYESRAGDAADSDLTLRLAATRRNLGTNTTSLSAVLDLMDQYEMSTTDHRATLLSATHDISTTLTNTDVALSMLGEATKAVVGWFKDNGLNLLLKIALFFVILLGANLVARFVRMLVATAVDRSAFHPSTLLRRILLAAAFNLVMAVGVLVALGQLGISLAPLLAGFGVVGFILGFALQDSLSNFAAGVMILVYRPYDVGDIVDVGGAFGRVDSMSLVSTTILTYDNQTIVVPNSKIWGDVIKNLTHQNIRRVDMTFGISYSDDIPKAEGVLHAICKDDSRILDDPEPQIHLHTLGESSVDFVVRPWVSVDDYWDVYWHVTREVKMRFDAEGISIPFPQRDVHLFKEPAADPPAPPKPAND